jgi:serpin B
MKKWKTVHVKSAGLLSAVLTVCVILAACQSGNDLQTEKEKPDRVERQDIPLTKAEENIVKGNNAFGFNLLQALSEEEKKGNIFISPLSASLALGMLNNGAAGITSEEIRSALGYEGISTEDLNGYFQKMLATLTTLDPEVTLESANSIWIRNNFQVLPAFIEVNQNSYEATVSHADFSDPATLGLINGWCAEKTHGKIDEILTEIPSDVMIYLLNALYFKGLWTDPFEKSQTKDAPFANENGRKSIVPMMRQEVQMNYARNDLVEMVEATYGNEAFSMVFMLPVEGATLSGVVENLASVWSDCLAGLSLCTIQLGIPRMELEYEAKFNSALKKLGMVSMFGAADLSGIQPGSNLFVSMVKQKTTLEVNEEGSEATAVTVVAISESASIVTPAPIPFILNRPFLVFIKEKSTGAILFEGLIRGL